MKRSQLTEALRTLDIPDEAGAEQRGWRLAAQAFEELESRDRSPRVSLRLVGALAAIATVLGVALSPAGSAFASWVRDSVGRDRIVAAPVPESTLSQLPANGKLLVTSAGGTWLMRADGSKRNLGTYEGTSWSPRGLFAVAWRGNELFAIDPSNKGEVRWSLARSDRVEDARWAPSGFRISYREAGMLRVVAGDGTGDRVLAERTALVAAAWRPGTAQRHELAYADRRGRIRLTDADAGRQLWEPWRCCAPAGRDRILKLAWSTDGALLAVLTPTLLIVRDLEGVTASLSVPGVTGATVEPRMQFRPGAHEIALASRRVDGSTQLQLVSRSPSGALSAQELATAPAIGELAWSPDGTTLLAAWPAADQWLFFDPENPDRIEAATGVARQFDPGVDSPSQPRIAGWCCPLVQTGG